MTASALAASSGLATAKQDLSNTLCGLWVASKGVRREAEGGRRKAEGGRRKAEGGRRKAEGGRRKAEGGRCEV